MMSGWWMCVLRYQSLLFIPAPNNKKPMLISIITYSLLIAFAVTISAAAWEHWHKSS
jgi:hypothetical protein